MNSVPSITENSTNADSTNADSTNADSTNADSTNADSTNADSTNADSTNADSTNADSTTADSTTADKPDASPADPDWPGQLVVFDGDCPLCRRSVHAIVAHEAWTMTGLVTLQSALGHQLGDHFGEDAEDLDSMWLIRDGALYRDSDGLWRTAQSLTPPWSAAAGLRWLPVPLRDGCYRMVGRYRKKLATDPGMGGAVQSRLLTRLTRAQCDRLSLPATLAET